MSTPNKTSEFDKAVAQMMADGRIMSWFCPDMRRLIFFTVGRDMTIPDFLNCRLN